MLSTQKKLKGVAVVVLFCLLFAPHFLFLAGTSSFYEEVSTNNKITNTVYCAFHAVLMPTIIVFLAVVRNYKIGASIIVILHGLFLLSTSLYYNYAGSFLEPTSVMMSSNLSPVINHIFKQILSENEVLIGISYALSLGMIIKIPKNPFPQKQLRIISVICLAIVTLVGLRAIAAIYRYDLVDNRRKDKIQAIKIFGWNINYAFSLYQYLGSQNTDLPFPGKVCNAEGVFSTPTFVNKPKNLILIQVESLDQSVLGLKVNGHEVTPFLNRLRLRSAYFPNGVAQHRGGASQDSELSILYSIIPRNGTSGFNHLNFSSVTSLASLLSQEGFSTIALHGNYGQYFNRSYCLMNSGFQKFINGDDFEGAAKGWLSKDQDFLEQAYSTFTKREEPFFAYLITMQSHGPFQNYSKLGENFDVSGTLYSKIQKDYIRTLHEVDSALAGFFELLENDGLLETSLIVITSDHESQVKLTQNLELPSEFENTPFFIYYDDQLISYLSHPVSQYDLAPTVCDILGIPRAQNWIGSNMFSEECNEVIVNGTSVYTISFDDGSWSVELKNKHAQNIVDWSVSIQNSRR